MSPRQVLIEGAGCASSRWLTESLGTRLRTEHGQVEAQRVGVGDLERSAAADEQIAIALAGIDVAEAQAVHFTFGDFPGEAAAFFLAPAYESLDEAQSAVPLLYNRGEAGGEHNFAGID